MVIGVSVKGKLFPVCVAIISVFTIVWALSVPNYNENDTSKKVDFTPVSVTAIKVEPTSMSSYITAVGISKARWQLDLISPVAGKIKILPNKIDPSVKVTQGTLLSSIVNTSYQSALASAISRMAQAELELARFQHEQYVVKQLTEGKKRNPFGNFEPHIKFAKAELEAEKVANLGKRKNEVVIKPDYKSLKKYGLTLEQLNDRIHQWSLVYRSGTLKTASGQIVLRGDNYADNLKSLNNLPIVTSSQSSVFLRDIANIERGFEDDDSIVRFNGQNAIALLVSTSSKDNLLDVSRAVKSVLTNIQLTLPVGVQTTVMADMAPYIEDQLDLLSTNAWQGLIIIIVLLGVFLEIRLALWVALGIPISVAGAISLMGLPAFDYSINDITLFGMILVLGILVDDAVVVGESIHSARKKYNDPKEAALKGVESVAVATTFGVLTTIAAFSPMLWIENELAQVLAGFSAVVIFALIFSLIESKFILPTHLCMPKTIGMSKNSLTSALEYIRDKCNRGLTWFSNHIYQPVLVITLQHKTSTLLLFICMVIGSYGALMKGSIKSVFFPEIPGRYATLKVTMDQDAALTLTQINTNKLEKALEQTNKLLSKEYLLEQPAIDKYLISMDANKNIEITAELSKEVLSSVSSDELLKVWQEQTGEIEGAYAVSYTQAQ